MATKTGRPCGRRARTSNSIEMAWDPITRIVGSLGIYTKIDWANKTVAECHSTSSIFRGYSIFMKGKDPRDAHFITSRICGICGDNHATCSCYARTWRTACTRRRSASRSSTSARRPSTCSTTTSSRRTWSASTSARRWSPRPTPACSSWPTAPRRRTPRDHGCKTIGDIMRTLNPFTGEFYREALQVSRYTREMFCLMEGRHVHPSTLYPGGVGTTATIQLFTDYASRLMRYVEFMKRVVPLHDDLFDFFYEAMPGYEQVGNRRILLGCWGAYQDPDVCNFQYKDMTKWGRAMGVTPGVVVDGKLVTNDLVDINLGHPHPARQLVLPELGRPGDVRRPRIRSATRSTATTRGTRRPSRGRRSATSTPTTAGSCRRVGSTARTTSRSTRAAVRSPGCGRPRCRAWSTSAAT